MAGELITEYLRYKGHTNYAPKAGEHQGDAGYDLFVAEDLDIVKGQISTVKLGISIEMPPGHWGFITPRSSTLRKYGLHVAAGVVDSGYRGELIACVANIGSDTVHLSAGDRICQLVLIPIANHWPVINVENLSDSDRGNAGFGSTGK